MNINDLKPASYNPRKITDAQLNRLGKAMSEFGDLSGIVFNVRTGNLIGGHQRIKHFDSSWPIIKNDSEDSVGTVATGHIETPTGLWSYREVDWDEIKEKAANVAANKHGGDFDIPLLEDLMVTLKDAGYDTELTGFDIDELAGLVGSGGGLTDDDAVPEPPEEPITQLGDLWLLGDHRLLCGDSTDIVQVERLMDGKKADMVFTDPPYGIDLDTDYSKMPSTKDEGNKKYNKIIGDNGQFDVKLISTIFINFGYCKEIFIFGADYFAEHIDNRNSGSWCVWDKRVTENFDNMIGSGFELCWSKARHKRMLARINNTLFSGESEARNKVHPTQKPIKLVEWFFDYWSVVGKNNVVDLYLGSGTTLIACEKTNRKCYGMELDPIYCDVIVKRWEEYTGKKGRLEDGETRTKTAADI